MLKQLIELRWAFPSAAVSDQYQTRLHRTHIAKSSASPGGTREGSLWTMTTEASGTFPTCAPSFPSPENLSAEECFRRMDHSYTIATQFSILNGEEGSKSTRQG